MRELAGRIWPRRPDPTRDPHLSFGSWEEFPDDEPRVVQICHPDWRGVRTAAYAFRSPVVEVDDLSRWGDELLTRFKEMAIDLVVIQGWPPSSEEFVVACHAAGLTVKCVLHSSPALQGDSPAEAAVIGQALQLRRAGVLKGLATDKAGVVEAFASIGYELTYLPNRAPHLGDIEAIDLGTGSHVGVFGEPWWPKNINTQTLAAMMLSNSVAHVAKDLLIDYVPSNRYVVHGELSRRDFLQLLGSVDLNLYVTFTECHPLLPIESYLLGIPCLISRASAIFRDDPVLWELTTVDSPDEPVAIADAATTLIGNKEIALDRALLWITKADSEAQAAWTAFTSV